MPGDSHVIVSVLLLAFSSVSFAIYLITDYYMDDGWPKSFGQVCGQVVHDDCAYINSHLNTFGIANYDSDISCTMMFDAGKQSDARYKFTWKRFELEDSTNCTFDSLTFYDAQSDNISSANIFGSFCGSADPNTTGFPSNRFATLKFKTDGGTNKKGFRLLATRTVPYPCPGDDYFHCKAENRCIDGRLKCDGTVQCEDETDEDGCSFWEKLIGGFLALGVAGIVGITGSCVCFCISVGVTICICKCCRERCGCASRGCSRCWTAICSPVKDKLGKLKPTKVGAGSHASDKVELVDVDETVDGKAAVGEGVKKANVDDKRAENVIDAQTDSAKVVIDEKADKTIVEDDVDKDDVAELHENKRDIEDHGDKDKVITREKTVTPRDAVIGIVNVAPGGAQATNKEGQSDAKSIEETHNGKEPVKEPLPEETPRPMTSSKTGRKESIGLAQDGGLNKENAVTKVDTE